MEDADIRRTEQGDEIPAAAVRDFIRTALQHHAVVEAVHDLMFEHVVEARYHPTVVAAGLRPMLVDVLDAASESDWRQVAADLTADAREALGHGDARVPDRQARGRQWAQRRR